MYVRPYKKCDAKTILSWIPDERSFRKWSADRYESYPADESDMNDMYEKEAYSDNFFPMTAYDRDGVTGHFIMRFTDADKKVLRLGFIIIDIKKRGQGLGEEMVRKACSYAFDYLGAEKVTLGVFDNNPEAGGCYQKAGFHERLDGRREVIHILGEEWTVTELEKKNHYFLTDYEKKKQGGSDYFEFRGKNRETGKEECLFLSAADYQITGLKQLLKREITNFNQYGHNDISEELWKRLRACAEKTGGPEGELINELSSWAENVMEGNRGFEIIGL